MKGKSKNSFCQNKIALSSLEEGGAGLGRQGFPWPYCHPDDTACFARDFTVRAHNNNIIQKKKKKYKIQNKKRACVLLQTSVSQPDCAL